MSAASPGSLTDRLLDLAAEPDRLTERRLWAGLSAADRAGALGAALRGIGRVLVLGAITTARGVRPFTLQKWDDARIAAFALKIPTLPGRLLGVALVDYTQHRTPEIPKAFWDHVGIPNPFDPREMAKRDGNVDDEPTVHGNGAKASGSPLSGGEADSGGAALTQAGGVDLPTVGEGYSAAAQSVWRSGFDKEAALLYFCTLHTIGFPLHAWMKELAGSRAQTAGPAPASAAPAEKEALLLEQTPQSDGETPAFRAEIEGDFSALDRLLITAAVDCAGGIEGALDEIQFDAVIDELLQLNGRRHRSSFHAGFRDALVQRECGELAAADNDHRRRWYLAGYVSGIARKQRWDEVLRIWDRDPFLRKVPQASDTPARYVAPIVLDAMAGCGRDAEALTAVSADVLRVSEPVRQRCLQMATALVRSHRASEARGLIELLDDVVSEMETEGPDDDAFVMEVRRRHALCLRQLGEKDQALQILEGLRDAGDVAVRASALTDIGLIHAGYRRLGELVLPGEWRDVSTFLTTLARGKRDFEQAVAIGGPGAGRAAFCLGIAACGSQAWPTAIVHLETALRTFMEEPEIYQLDNSLSLARLYLGVAIAHHEFESIGRIRYATELIGEGVRSGVAFPDWALHSTLQAVWLANPDMAADLARHLLEHAPTRLDDLLAAEAVAAAPGVQLALFARAADARRTVVERAADFRVVLPWLAAVGDGMRARAALEFLVAHAMRGVGRDELLALLNVPESLSAAWSFEEVTEAAILLLEAAGRYDEAAAKLEAYAHLVLAEADDYSLDEVSLHVAKLREYGPAGAAGADRLDAVLAARIGVPEPPSPDVPLPAVRILVVGGNEVQARMDRDIADRVGRELPGVSVSFLHPGWNGNWSAHVAEFERRARSVEGVVFLSLMRTEFGWNVRSRCPVPWRGCSGRGQGAVFETIVRAADAARLHLAREHQEQYRAAR